MPSECTFPDCHRTSRAKGMCESHYRQMLRTGVAKTLREDRPKPKCRLCERDAEARGLCSSHYQREKRHGDPTAGRAPNGTRKPRGPRKPKPTALPPGWNTTTTQREKSGAVKVLDLPPARPLTQDEIDRTRRLFVSHGQADLLEALGIAS